jgi:hypothetical protein
VRAPRERAVAKAEAAFRNTNGFSPLWDHIVEAWTVAYEATDILATEQFQPPGYCLSCDGGAHGGHAPGCKLAAVLAKVAT